MIGIIFYFLPITFYFVSVFIEGRALRSGEYCLEGANSLANCALLSFSR